MSSRTNSASPGRSHQVPGKESPDAVRVAHHPRVKISDAVLVVEGDGQHLEAVKSFVLQVPADIHLHSAGLVGGDAVHQDLEQQHKNVDRRKTAHSFRRVFADKIPDGVIREEGEDDIYQPAQDPRHHHQEQRHPVGADPGSKKFQAEPGKLCFSVLCHDAAPPSSSGSDCRRQILAYLPFFFISSSWVPASSMRPSWIT